MKQRFQAFYHTIRKHLKPVIYQNTLSLVNGIFLTVTLLLLVFKEIHEALFLAVVLVLNVVVGIVQDLRAKVALEQLQILMAPHITRIGNHGKEETILLEHIELEDKLKLKLGDQIPADGELVETNGLEVNEALLSGESNNNFKTKGNQLLAGSFVTAGSGVLRVTSLPKNSFVAQMTEKIKQYTLNLSPIQKTLNQFITYMTYLLLAIVVYVIVHGITVHELLVSMVKDIAALTNTLVPQGLILATTVFFAYGAIKLLRKEVLLQEINATEKLGRIKNLCIDKTGTLTENRPTLDETQYFAPAASAEVSQLLAGYRIATADKSETLQAISEPAKTEFQGTIVSSLPFSSSRKFGAAILNLPPQDLTVVLGAPDILLPKISDPDAKLWVQASIDKFGPKAKRLVLLAKTNTKTFQDLETANLTPVAMFILSNPLRPGTKEIIDFFQARGVHIRVISGDNAKTVQAVALQAGIKHADMIITGPEMENWDEEAYLERVPAYHLFARIKPDQKEKIISILKKTDFTAMVGDGANDALAIKKSDLGIAMFDGAGATRQIAQIVLMNNSFAALPAGVSMAETIITNIELVASIFFNKVTVGLALFVLIGILGHTYPLSPRNTTIINYVTIWLPMIYWAVFPAHKIGADSGQSFLRKVLPYSLLAGTLTAMAAVTAFLLGPKAYQIAGSNILVVLTITALEFWFFVLAPVAYGIAVSAKQKSIIWILGGLSVLFFLYTMFTPGLSKFFDLGRPGLWPLFTTICIIVVFAWIQYQITKRWFNKQPTPN